MNNDTSNIINNNDNTYDTTCVEDNNIPIKIVPNRETRRKEMKKKYYNPHELNLGRINLSGTDMICLQKEKKKQFNNYIKGKVK